MSWSFRTSQSGSAVMLLAGSARQRAVRLWEMLCSKADSEPLLWGLILSEALGIPFHVWTALLWVMSYVFNLFLSLGSDHHRTLPACSVEIAERFLPVEAVLMI